MTNIPLPFVRASLSGLIFFLVSLVISPLYGQSVSGTLLGKAVHFTDTRSLEFRGSFCHVFKHTTFAKPSTTNLDSSSAGQITTLDGSKQVELAAKSLLLIVRSIRALLMSLQGRVA